MGTDLVQQKLSILNLTHLATNSLTWRDSSPQISRTVEEITCGEELLKYANERAERND